MMKLLVLSVVAGSAAGARCTANENVVFAKGGAAVSVRTEAGATVGAPLDQAGGAYCLADGCYSFESAAPFTVHDEFALLADCGTRDCAERVCVSRVAPIGDADLAPKTEIRDAAASDQHSAARRMTEMFSDIRRLQYSYNFDCVNSLKECMDDDNCDDDEECFIAQSRKKQRLLNAEASSSSSTNTQHSRSLLFGGNAVGQCVCK